MLESNEFEMKMKAKSFYEEGLDGKSCEFIDALKYIIEIAEAFEAQSRVDGREGGESDDSWDEEDLSDSSEDSDEEGISPRTVHCMYYEKLFSK